ncbi:MAG: hypothetical protein ACKOI2_08970, partial [Actinomycetota bacterium]
DAMHFETRRLSWRRSLALEQSAISMLLGRATTIAIGRVETAKMTACRTKSVYRSLCPAVSPMSV